MDREDPNRYYFQPGGTLGEGAFYINREADEELFEALQKNEYCYILAPRQIGKSSLRARCQRKLEASGVRCVLIDLSIIGTDLTQEEWYAGLLVEISDGLSLENPIGYWHARNAYSPVARFLHYFTEVINTKITEPVVIFVDEIDLLRKLPFPGDDFLAAIRALFNKRADDPIYKQYSFCLIGVAAPGELIEDPYKTPFNIGKHIQLADFSLQQAYNFVPGLLTVTAGSESSARELIAEVIKWTDGHPYMTQRLCFALSTQSIVQQDNIVEKIVRTIFRDSLSDPNLTYAGTRILADNTFVSPVAKLSLYRRMLLDEQVETDKNNRAQSELQLAGLVKDVSIGVKRFLRIRNQIFRNVFDLGWIGEHSAYSSIADAHQRWVSSSKTNDYLLRGVALDQALQWSDGKEITAGEQEFIRASLVFREQEILAREKEQYEKRKQAEQRSKILRIGIISLSLLATGLLASVIYGIQMTSMARKAEATIRLSLASEKHAKDQAEEERRKAVYASEQMQSAYQREAEQRQIAEDALEDTTRASRAVTLARDQALISKAEAESAHLYSLEAADKAQGMQRRAEEATRVAQEAEAREAEARTSAIALADDIGGVVRGFIGKARPLSEINESLQTLNSKTTTLLDILKRQKSPSKHLEVFHRHAIAHLKDADADMASNHLSDAKRHYHEALSSAADLVRKKPDIDSYHLLIYTYMGLSKIAHQESDISKELECQYKLSKVREQIYAKSSNNDYALYNYIISLSHLAQLVQNSPKDVLEKIIPRSVDRDADNVKNKVRLLADKALRRRLIEKDKIDNLLRIIQAK